MNIRYLSRAALLGFVPLALLLSACGGSSENAATAAVPAAAKTLFISADVVQGSVNVPKDQAALFSCVNSSRFARNSQIVWRARISDPATGNLLDGAAVTKATVKLANGKDLDMVYGLHPKDTGEGYWTSSWMIPKDQATGTLKYSISVTGADGRTGTFEPFSVASALPSVLDQVLPDQTASNQ
jgi:hypothetical protein